MKPGGPSHKEYIMSRQKHFPSLNEYATWVARQPAGAVLGIAFDGIQYPYEAYLSEYYGLPVMVIAGDCYEVDGKCHPLPAEWEGFTVGYHDSDLYERAGGRSIEVTTEIEIAYLAELLGADAVKAPRTRKPAPKELRYEQVLERTQAGDRCVVYTVLSSNGEDRYRTTLVDGLATGCDCPAGRNGMGCYHRPGCEAHERFEQAWRAPLTSVLPAALLGEQFAQDMQAHVEDELGECALQAEQILQAERAAKVVQMRRRTREAAPLGRQGFQFLA